MRPRQEFIETTSNYVYNRVRRQILEKEGSLRCAHCPYNRGENDTRKFYSCTFNDGEHVANFPKRWERDRRPSWKLCSKNRKQWMKKPLKKVPYKNRFYSGYHYEW